MDILRRLRDAVRRETPRKMVDQQLVSPSRQCSSTPIGFGQGFPSKEQRDNSGAFLPTLLTWLYLMFICFLY
jgi:hypothetical protein